MFPLLVKLVGEIFDIIDRIKGPRNVVEKLADTPEGCDFKVITTAGFEFVIHCSEATYHAKYDGLFSSDQKRILYKIKSSCNDSVPVALRDKLTVEKTIPCLAPRFSTKQYKIKSAIRAYLDLLLNDLAKK